MTDRKEQREQQRLLTEIPSSLKQLARLVVRGFYTIEDALIVDMLVRNPCELLTHSIVVECCLIKKSRFHQQV